MVLSDRWTLDALLGVGGMAAVYAATHRNTKRVAIKLLHSELAAHQDIRERFLREGYAANRVGHPNVVTVHDDVVTADGSAFLVMDLVDGEALDTRSERKGGVLPPTEVLSIMDQVLDALAVAHEKGIVHRDLKPDNIVVTREGGVRVLDFGIARVEEEHRRSTPTTQSGILLGTPAFMAPEQARGTWEDVDRRTDIWAMGATMFTLLTGAFVHEAKTPNETIAMAITRPARSIKSLLPALDAAVVALVDRALAYDKEQRFSDAREMQQALRQAFVRVAGSREPMHSAPEFSLPDTPSLSSPTLESSIELVPASDEAGPPLVAAPPDRSPHAETIVGRRRKRALAFRVALLVGAGLAVAGVLAAWLFGSRDRSERGRPETGRVETAGPEAPTVPPRAASPSPDIPVVDVAGLPSDDESLEASRRPASRVGLPKTPPPGSNRAPAASAAPEPGPSPSMPPATAPAPATKAVPDPKPAPPQGAAGSGWDPFDKRL